MSYHAMIRAAAAVSCLASGTSVAAIAAQAGVHTSTVRRWIRGLIGPAQYQQLLAHVRETEKLHEPRHPQVH